MVLSGCRKVPSRRLARIEGNKLTQGVCSTKFVLRIWVSQRSFTKELGHFDSMYGRNDSLDEPAVGPTHVLGEDAKQDERDDSGGPIE